MKKVDFIKTNCRAPCFLVKKPDCQRKYVSK